MLDCHFQWKFLPIIVMFSIFYEISEIIQISKLSHIFQKQDLMVSYIIILK